MQVNITFEDDFDELYNNFPVEFLRLEGIAPEQLDIGLQSKKYFAESPLSMSIDKNANAYNIGPNNYTAEVMKPLFKLEGYYLLYRYAKRRFGEEKAKGLISAIWYGDVYFHDASGVGVQVPYCFAYSTSMLMVEGRPYGQLYSLPPKRADSFMSQVIETTMDFSQELMGAVGISDLFVNYAWYAKRENKPDYEIINDFQRFVHVMNNQFRVSGQSPFVNVSVFDREMLKRVWEDYVYPDGTKVDVEYVMHIQKLFIEWFCKGDPATGLPYRFPVVTANFAVEDGKILDEEFLEFIAEHNRKLGCLNIHAGSTTKVASCCRLINDPIRMRQFQSDSFGNGGLNIGSHRVVTINLPRAAARANHDIKQFKQEIRKLMETARDLLLVHRDIIKRRIEQGFLKFFDLGWMSLNMFFSTIGFTGFYEAMQILGVDPWKEVDVMSEIVKMMDEVCIEFSRETGWAFNLEETPAETAAVTLAAKDKVYFGLNDWYDLYSNQFYPLHVDSTNVVKRIKLTGKLMDYVSGGSILHINIADRIDYPEQMKKLIQKTIECGVTHFAINYGFCRCREGHVTIGRYEKCPICGGEIADYMTRIVGYFVPVSKWNEVRQQEFHKRVFYKLNAAAIEG